MSFSRTGPILKRFLFATLDESRLHHADQYANRVLKLTDIDDARHFRQGVLRREASGDIDWQRQRDHAAHTLHNYLLGWYIFEHHAGLRAAMGTAASQRLPPPAGRTREQQGLYVFLHAWPWVSLLHDVGYLFEGGLQPLNPSVHSERVKRGAEVVLDYFQNRFWFESLMSIADDRAKVREWTEVTEPHFSSFSLSAVADGLRTLGNLGTLWNSALAEMQAHRVPTRGLPRLNEGAGDAFEVWRRHYRVYSRPMERRIIALEKAFYAAICDGLPGIGVRLMDHGVSGGLLLLLYSTYSFQMVFGLQDAEAQAGADNRLHGLVRRMKRRFREAGIVYDAHWWWTVIVWATAATALHNLQQQPAPWPGGGPHPGPLRMKDDPLAYLGILVDILQEWDRYTVAKSSIFTGRLPLEGKDVQLRSQGGRVHIGYGDRNRSREVREALNRGLSDWDRVVVVSP